MLSVDQLKTGIEYQREYLRVNGPELFKRVFLETSDWEQEDRQRVKEVVNVFFSDEMHKVFGYEEDVAERSACGCSII